MLLSNTATNCVRGRLSDATSNRKVPGQSWGVVIGRASMERITIASNRCRVAQSILQRVQAFSCPSIKHAFLSSKYHQGQERKKKKRKTRRIFPCPFSTRQTSSLNRDKDTSSYVFILAPYLEQSINQSITVAVQWKKLWKQLGINTCKNVTIFPQVYP